MAATPNTATAPNNMDDNSQQSVSSYAHVNHIVDKEGHSIHNHQLDDHNAVPRPSSIPVPSFTGSFAPSIHTTNRTVEVMVDVKYSTSPQDLYNLMFDSDFLVHFLEDNQKVWDLEFKDWEKRNGDPNLLMRDFHYTRPNSGLGPKEVYCEEHEENQHRDDQYIETETTTHTPYVTYGKAFHVITHTKIARANTADENQGSILNVVLEIVWTGWCPIKGMIEGRVIDGQKQYSADMDSAVRDELKLRLSRGSVKSSSMRSPRSSPKTSPRTVRFSVDRKSYSPESTADEKSDIEREPSWMEKQQAPTGPYIGLQNHLQQQTWANRIRLFILLVLVSYALALLVLRVWG
ncbi:hypothetical protein DL93DRAFT_2072261 [Clavulina sp. PMI_390]|nr:hypothetical protein DL93DRAFT_2072261 [Clavulina sp. PMI_390]